MIIIRHAIGSRSIWENLGLENFLTYIDPRSNVPPMTAVAFTCSVAEPRSAHSDRRRTLPAACTDINTAKDRPVYSLVSEKTDIDTTVGVSYVVGHEEKHPHN